MVRNTSGQSINDVAIYEDDIERLTVKSSVDEGHVDAEKLDDGLADPELERADEGLGPDLAPRARMDVEARAHSARACAALLWVVGAQR